MVVREAVHGAPHGVSAVEPIEHPIPVPVAVGSVKERVPEVYILSKSVLLTLYRVYKILFDAM